MSEKFSRSNAAGRRQVHRLQPCIMRGTRQSADLCLRAATGCCRIRKQVGAILKVFKCWKSSLVLRFASIRSHLASSCLALDDGMPELAPTGGRHWPANGVSGGTGSVTMFSGIRGAANRVLHDAVAAAHPCWAHDRQPPLQPGKAAFEAKPPFSVSTGLQGNASIIRFANSRIRRRDSGC